MRKLRAFTLLELLFVMILTTIILGMGYFAFSTAVKQMYVYKENSKKIAEKFLFTTFLQRDFMEAASVFKSSDTLVFSNAMNERLQYFFSDEYIVRSTNSVEDTFFYKTQNKNEKFLDMPVDVSNGLVDEIYFEIINNNEQFEIFHAVKSYGADALIEYESLNKSMSLQ